MDDEFIVCKDIKKKFKNIVAIDNLNFTFKRSYFYAIMGPSGAGKSTFLQILGLLDKADDGQVILDDVDIFKLSEKQKSEYREKYFGFVFQSCFLNSNFTAVENIMLPMLLNRTITDARKSAEQLMEKFNLDDRKSHYPKQLSGGEQQRVAIARALANNPECILADEPTGNLDEENEKAVFEIMKKICKEQNKCIICVTHSDNILKYADKVLFYQKGRLSE